MSDDGICKKITMPFPGKYHELRVGNALRQDFRRAPVVDIAGDVAVVLAYEDQGRYTDIFETKTRIVTLARDQVAQVKLYGAEIRHSTSRYFATRSGYFFANSSVNPTEIEWLRTYFS